MFSLLKASLLIPVLPLVCASFVGLLLLSFSRTMNRLTKPVSFLLINSLIISSTLSILLLINHISGEILTLNIHILNLRFALDFNLDYSAELVVSAISIFSLLLLTTSFIRLPRAQGYVGYVTLVSFLTGFLLLLVFGSDFTQVFL